MISKEVHCDFFSYNDKGVAVLGNTYSGKGFLVIEMLDRETRKLKIKPSLGEFHKFFPEKISGQNVLVIKKSRKDDSSELSDSIWRAKINKKINPKEDKSLYTSGVKVTHAFILLRGLTKDKKEKPYLKEIGRMSDFERYEVPSLYYEYAENRAVLSGLLKRRVKIYALFIPTLVLRKEGWLPFDNEIDPTLALMYLRREPMNYLNYNTKEAADLVEAVLTL
ncbi:MAG: hypothetical protein ABIF92_02105 [archaeon]